MPYVLIIFFHKVEESECCLILYFRFAVAGSHTYRQHFGRRFDLEGRTRFQLTYYRFVLSKKTSVHLAEFNRLTDGTTNLICVNLEVLF